jgi:hypothetical protein
MVESDWLCTKEASSYLKTIGCFISPKTLANLRNNNNAGKGPTFSRTRWKTVRYLKADLQAWAAQNVERVE